MAGIYIHIPFCRRKCGYCNFFSLATTRSREAFTSALVAELHFRAREAASEAVGTVYWGGGTPSLLEPIQFRRIMEAIHASYALEPDAEITLEANPDDLLDERLRAWKQGGVNRVSIGIQSFRQADLDYLERAHDAAQALRATDLCRKAGIDNLSIDLIYGIPGQGIGDWEENLRQFLRLGVDHLSAYALTLEERTILWHQVQRRQRKPPEDALAAQHFELMHRVLAAEGYAHYEISNLARNERYARHNTAYWNGIPYYGFGPSAHSFDGRRRYWNVSSLKDYIEALPLHVPMEGEEVLSLSDRINEYLMTSLRTQWGCRRRELLALGGEELLGRVGEGMTGFIRSSWVLEDPEGWKLSPEGMFHADGIAAELFVSHQG